MMFANLLLTILLLGLCWNGAVAQKIFEDDFSGSTLDPAWTRTPGVGSISVQSGSLVVANSNLGKDRWGLVTTVSRSFSGKNWVLETKVNYHMDTTGTQQGRFFNLDIFWSNDDYIQYSRRKDCCSPPPNDHVDTYIQSGGSSAVGTVRLDNVPGSPNDVHLLRVVREGQKITISRQIVGHTDFTVEAEYEFPGTLGLDQELRLYAITHARESSSAAWDYFRVYVPCASACGEPHFQSWGGRWFGKYCIVAAPTWSFELTITQYFSCM
jgi:hypothetical protein